MIVIRGLEKFYGTHHVLKGIDASVAKGEVVCIIGPSGSGKSTIINLLTRLYENCSGSIEIDGVDIRKFGLASYLHNFAIVQQ